MPPPGAPGLVTVGGDGTIRRFAGWPLVEVQVSGIGENPIGDAAFGDIDNDGALELVTATWFGELRAHDLATGNLRWQLDDMDTQEILLAQLDGRDVQ